MFVFFYCHIKNGRSITRGTQSQDHIIRFGRDMSYGIFIDLLNCSTSLLLTNAPLTTFTHLVKQTLPIAFALIHCFPILASRKVLSFRFTRTSKRGSGAAMLHHMHSNAKAGKIELATKGLFQKHEGLSLIPERCKMPHC